jgi:hypothetical protein
MVQFSYALNEKDAFKEFGPATPLAKFSWWKGSRPAVFTYIKSDTDEVQSTQTSRNQIKQNYIDVDWFRVSDWK